MGELDPSSDDGNGEGVAPLRSAVVHGVAWNYAGIATQSVGQLVVSTILARLLTPADFGLIALVNVGLAFSRVFVDGGFGSALIQKKAITRDDETTVFFFNIVVGVVFYLLAFGAAPYLSDWLGYDELRRLIPVLALVIPLASLGAVHQRVLHRRLDFRTQVLIEIVATLLSGAAGIVAALNGMGVWSLVIQAVAIHLLRVVGLWCFAKWWPTGRFRFASMLELGRFGVHIFFASILNTVFDNVYPLIIGTSYSSEQLGLYSRARRYQSMPSQTLASSAKRAMFPVFSKLQEDKPRLLAAMKRSMLVLVFLIFPSMAMLFATAENLVTWILLEKWLPMTPYLKVLCLAGALYPVSLLNLTLLNAQGLSHLTLRLEIVKKLLIIVAIAVTFRWGVLALVYGQVIAAVIGWGLNTYYTHRSLNYGLAKQVMDMLPYGCFAVLSGAAMMIVQASLDVAPSIEVLAAFAVGVPVYWVACHVAKCSAYEDVMSIVRDYKLGRSRVAAG